MKRPTQFNTYSVLLALLAERFDLLGLDKAKAYSKPQLDPVLIETAARQAALANNSDPFYYNRIKHYMKQGYELPSDVLNDANSLLAARQAAKESQYDTV